MPDCRRACDAYPPVLFHSITPALAVQVSGASGRVILVLVQDAVLGAYCLSQFTHKQTLPRNANQMKNTTKPNSFLAREKIRGYTFDTNIHTALPPASP